MQWENLSISLFCYIQTFEQCHIMSDVMNTAETLFSKYIENLTSCSTRLKYVGIYIVTPITFVYFTLHWKSTFFLKCTNAANQVEIFEVKIRLQKHQLFCRVKSLQQKFPVLPTS